VDLVLVGLDHKTAPVALRERFYLADETLCSALERLQAEGLAEVGIISTCNRVEIYACVEDAEDGSRLICNFLAASQNILIEEIHSHLYILRGREVAYHLMRVASGLESQILGETQILGQVAYGLEQAQATGTSGAILSRLFTAALHAGKRARSETDISRHTLSVSHAAVLLIQQQMTLSTAMRVLVVGAGQMAVLAVKALQSHDVRDIRLINRTDTKTTDLAVKLGVQAGLWHNLSAAIGEADVVIAATSAPKPIISAEHLETVSSQERKQPRLLVDIGLPRNIVANIENTADVRLYDIDDLERVVATHLDLRQGEITHVEVIIHDELEVFMDWLNSRDVVPLITELRLHAEALAQIEIEQALHRLPDIDAHEQEVLTQMAHRIVNKLLHAPTVNLKSHILQDHRYDYAHAVRELFSLDTHKSTEQMNHE
jgi:glutamyl-tRNA reductase